MFIDGRCLPVTKAPEGRQVPPGYGRHENWNVSNRSCMRRGWVPQPAGRGNLSPTMDTAPPILPHLPPERRQVAPGYGRHENWNVSNRSCMRRGWVPQPMGEETSPPRWTPSRQFCRIYPQRGDRSHQDTGDTKIGT